MTPISNWEPIIGLPDTLEKLLKGTEINNSFRETDVNDTLKDTMESSYSFLYRMQQDSVNYSRHHFQTREFLLTTTYSDIQTGLKTYGDMLIELEKSENPDKNEISKLKRILAEFGEVRFGDLYLDSKRRVSVNIDHDIIPPETKEIFRRSSFYRTDLSMGTLLNNSKIFREIPVAIIDNEVRMDISVYPLEQGTKIIFNHMNAKDLYNTKESQIFHDICILFIPNTNIEVSVYDKDMILSGIIPLSNLKMDKKGSYFMTVKGQGEKHSSHLIPVNKVNETNMFIFDVDKRLKELVNSSKVNNFEVSIIFFQDLFKYDFKGISNDNTVSTRMRGYYINDNYIEKAESEFFIPKINGNILYMPIPEDNILVMKAVYVDSKVDRYEPSYGCSVNLHYPNIYQINDIKQEKGDKYQIYFFYKEMPEIKYTSITDFYWDYLMFRYNNKYSLEEVINKVYFRDTDYNINQFLKLSEDELSSLDTEKMNLNDDYLNIFYSLFEKMLEYSDYRYNYGTPDFIDNYKGDEIPLQYKISKMMEFIRADWKVLPEYVKKERRKETLFHFFTNTINLSGRFRRSTRLEDREHTPISFASECILADASNPNSLLVSDSKSYDKENEVFIDDVKILLPNVKVGDYVELKNLTDRYVFAFRNHGEDMLKMKVYIDGLLCSDIVTVNSLGTDYLYLPTNAVSENSYIMMELEWSMDDTFIQTLEFTDNAEWKTVHIVENEHIEYTMNDILIKLNGSTLNKDNYTLQLIRHEIPYSMYDENHKIENKYGIVTDINIQLTNVDISSSVSVDVIVNKTSFFAYGVAKRNGYPRFDLTKIKLKHDVSRARLYYNGRLAPSNTFRSINSAGREYIQSRIFCETGDEYLFEYSPYTKEVICEMTEFDPNEVIDFSKYIDKPLDPEYYEVFVNGRRLGLPNIFKIGPYHTAFRGVKSKYLLSIFEKERDFEYFGYSKVLKDGEEFFYTINNLFEESFISEREIKLIIDVYIEKIKHEDVIIEPNNLIESPITYDIESGLIEEMKIFFFEELLPLGLGNPDEVQFNKAYFSEVFPNFTKEFLVEGEDDNPDVIYLNPDVTARIYNAETNEYEIIDTKDVDPEKSFVMLMGEAE